MPSYVVYKGRVPGIYDDWEECWRQVHHFSGNSYKGYNTRADTEGRYVRYLAIERIHMRRNWNEDHRHCDDNHRDREDALCDRSLDQ